MAGIEVECSSPDHIPHEEIIEWLVHELEISIEGELSARPIRRLINPLEMKGPFPSVLITNDGANPWGTFSLWINREEGIFDYNEKQDVLRCYGRPMQSGYAFEGILIGPDRELARAYCCSTLMDILVGFAKRWPIVVRHLHMVVTYDSVGLLALAEDEVEFPPPRKAVYLPPDEQAMRQAGLTDAEQQRIEALLSDNVLDSKHLHDGVMAGIQRMAEAPDAAAKDAILSLFWRIIDAYPRTELAKLALSRMADIQRFSFEHDPLGASIRMETASHLLLFHFGMRQWEQILPRYRALQATTTKQVIFYVRGQRDEAWERETERLRGQGILIAQGSDDAYRLWQGIIYHVWHDLDEER